MRLLSVCLLSVCLLAIPTCVCVCVRSDMSAAAKEQCKTQLTLNGFLQGAAQIVPALAGPPRDTDEARRLIDCFRRFDVDGTGLVSIENFRGEPRHPEPTTRVVWGR